MESPVPIRFFVQNPLGRLARWLRILGFDAQYEPETPRKRRKSAVSGSVLLTRSIAARTGTSAQPTIVIQSDHVQDQLGQVIRETRLTREQVQPFSRCLRCNQPVQRVHKSDIAGRVPDHVWEIHDSFSTCRSCGKIYWKGTHAERTDRIIASLFDRTIDDE